MLSKVPKLPDVCTLLLRLGGVCGVWRARRAAASMYEARNALTQFRLVVR
jgi:hypothetical protein